MDEDVKKFSVKFIETTGRWADIELFNEEDAWEFMKDLLDEYGRTNTPLSDGQIIVLRNLGAALGVKPGSALRGYIPAVVRHFGPSPMPDEDLHELARWAYKQINGSGNIEPARKAPLTLQATPPGEFPGRRRRKRR